MRSTLSVLFLSAACALNAQSFQTHLGGPRHQDAVAAFPDAQGITVVVRDVTDVPAGIRVRLLRTSTAGAEQAWHEVTLPGAAFVQGAIQDGSVFVLCGSLIRPGRDDQDAFIVKVDALGAVQWSWTTDTPDEEEQLLDIERMTDGRYAAAGMHRTGGDSNAYIAVVTSAGAPSWAGTFGGPTDEKVNALIVDAQGLTAVGQVMTTNMHWNAYVLRTDVNGAEQWSQARGGPMDDEAYSVVPLAGNAFAWAGWTETYGDTDMYGRHNRNVLLMAMNTNGDSLWARAFGDTLMQHQAGALALAGNGDLLIGGKQYIGPDGSSLMIRTSSTGTAIWKRTYDILGEEEIRTIMPLTANGGFVGCGWGFGPDGGEVLLLRKDAQGN